MLHAVDRFALAVDRATMLDVHCFDTVGWVIKLAKKSSSECKLNMSVDLTQLISSSSVY